MSDLVEVIHDGNVALLRLNRPETLNALTPELMSVLATNLEQLDADPEARCLVITGGPDVFASGADAAYGDHVDPELLESAAEFWERVGACETPMIAAVSGFALGSGCELALLCDIIICSDTAEFGQPEITLGLIPGGGGTQRLARLVGKQHAMEIVLTGRRIKAEDGRKMGLVNAVHGRAGHLEEALEMAGVIARRPPLAAKLAKQAVLNAERMELDGGLGAERRLYEQAMETEDRVEAMRAFREKRKPDFKGS